MTQAAASITAYTSANRIYLDIKNALTKDIHIESNAIAINSL